MKIKPGVEVKVEEFWYDLTAGGYIQPERVLASKSDIARVKEAIKVITEFERALVSYLDVAEEVDPDPLLLPSAKKKLLDKKKKKA